MLAKLCSIKIVGKLLEMHDCIRLSKLIKDLGLGKGSERLILVGLILTTTFNCMATMTIMQYQLGNWVIPMLAMI